jgi:hypothetical protein
MTDSIRQALEPGVKSDHLLDFSIPASALLTISAAPAAINASCHMYLTVANDTMHAKTSL